MGKGGKGKHGKKRKHGSGGGKDGGKGKGGKGGGGSEGKGKRRGMLGPLPERAFIISSDSPQASPKATKEAQRLLTDAFEALQASTATGNIAEVAVAQEKSSLISELEAELQELRGDGATAAKRPRIRFHGEVTRGISVLACPQKADSPNFPAPSVLVESVLATQRRESTSRFVVRLLPLDYVCSPHLSNFRDAVRKHLPVAFAGMKEGTCWYIACFFRAMATIKREDVLSICKEVLGPLGMDLSVSDAEYTIMVEVNPSLCGFSVLRDYENGLHECHVQRACRAKEDDDDDDQDSEESGDCNSEGVEASHIAASQEISEAASTVSTEQAPTVADNADSCASSAIHNVSDAACKAAVDVAEAAGEASGQLAKDSGEPVAQASDM